ncbi:hypothetical protein GOBAR_AA20923 [Gossypium barbadense]|uniref:Importin N-terminal domain-containing protein n=1 Tax=Gossypium barbadense TaxID=3634 RepID=A0A2P5X8V3_GOSBA|nr:hypothetical protein GOBAR_AA20923 [Gossypium barbadense]
MDQQSQLAVILGSEPVPFETLISHLMSSSNEQRSHAEALFNVCKQSDPDPDALCLRLAHLLQVCAQPDTRAMAAILLRKLLTRDDSYIWPRLTHSSIKSVLLNQIQVETAQSLSQKLCDTVSELASMLDSSSERDRFQDLLPAMMKTLMEALNNGNEATAQEALELLIELGGRLLMWWARERASGIMRKLPQFISRLFAILVRLLLDIEDDAAWHTAEVEDEDAGETSNYAVGQECLDRLAISLGGNTIVPVASEQFSTYLAAPEWQKHHAALIALAQIAEGCSKVMVKNLEQVVSMVLNSFNHSHIRVRTNITKEYCIALAAAMDDFQNPRVMEVLMSLQGSQMETDDPTTSYMLQAWARLCKCLGQDFLPYMTVVIPPLLQSAQLKPDVTITSADSDNDIEDSDDESSPRPSVLLDESYYDHWLIILDFPERPKPLEEEMIDAYVKTQACVVGSEEEAKKRIYSVCTTRYTGFRAFFSVDLIDELRGDIFVDGKVLHRPQFPWVGGCGDDELWLITFEFRGEPSLEEKIDFYVKTLAYVVGSEEEAKRRIYAVGGGLTRYTGFRAVLSEGMAYELQGLPLVEGVYRVEEYNEDVDGGHLLVDGKVVLRPASFGQKRPKVGRLADLLHFLQDQMLDVIYGEETKSNSGGKNRSRASIRLFRYLYL